MAVLRTFTWDEPRTVSDVLKHEYSGDYCHETVTILSGSGKLEIGTVLAKITKGAATAAAKSGGNTGNGALTMDATTPVLAGAQAGVYKVRFVAAVSDGGLFEVEDPTGVVIGTGTVGTAWAEQVKFSIADGATDFVVGDGFDITVAAGSGKWAPYEHGAINGLSDDAVVLLQYVDATDADQPAQVLFRGPAVCGHNGYVWDDSVDNQAKKDAAIALLEKRGIITRASA